MSAADTDFPDAESGRLSDRPGEVGLSVVYTIEPGRVEIDGEAVGNLEVGAGNIVNSITGNVPDNTVNITYSTEGINNIRTEVNNLVGAISSESGIPESALQQMVSGSVPPQLQNIPSEGVALQASFGSIFGGGVQTVGESPVDFEKEITFPTITLPDLPAARRAVANIPSPTLVISARQTATFQRIGAELLGVTPEIRVDIPPWAFFNFVSPDRISCAELYQDLDRRVDEINSVTERAASQFQSDIEALRSIIAGLPIGASPSGDSIGEDVIQQIRNASTTSLREQLSQNRLEEMISTLEQVQPDRVDPDNLQSRFESIQDEIEGLGQGRCETRFSDRLSGVESRISTIQALQPQVDTLTNVLDQLIPGEVQREEPDVDLSCADVPQSLRNRARSFSSAAQGFEGGARITNLLTEGEGVLEDIRNEVSEDNPCREELVGEVRTGLTRLRQRGGEEEEEGIREIVPCSEANSSLANDVEDFFDQAMNLSPSASADQVGSLISQGRDLVNRINQNAERERCAEEFSSTVRAALDRISRLQGEVTIVSGDTVGDLPEERRQRLDEVISQLEGITAGFEGDIGEGDLPDQFT